MVRTGLDILIGERMADFAGLRVGITASRASITAEGRHIAEAFLAAGGNLAALFAPEHGLWGDLPAGQDVDDDHDPRLGVHIYSLYGANKAPTPAMLREIDVMIVDLQDIGARFWTFESTLSLVMEACGRAHIPVYVLDRPNPITGLNAEGPVLEPAFSSFVGRFPIRLRHGLTIGELARLLQERFGIECDLIVVEMEGWDREKWFDQTGLPWVPPSPGMRTLDTATVYPGTCLLEGTNVSEGRGTDRPFEVLGAPWLDAATLSGCISEYNLPGVKFDTVVFTPASAKFQGVECHGLHINVTDRQAFRPVVTGVAIVCVLRQFHPTEFAFREPGPDGRCFFDLLAGTDAVREAVESGSGAWEIAGGWNP